MTQRKIRYIDGGSPEYWRQRTEGFRLIHEAERALVRVERAPMYIAGNWDDDYGDYEPIETSVRSMTWTRRSKQSRQTRPPSTFLSPCVGHISVNGRSRP